MVLLRYRNFSFHSQKNLTTLGEGGMIVVKNQDLAKHVKGLRLNGHAPFVNKDEYLLPAMTNGQYSWYFNN